MQLTPQELEGIIKQTQAEIEYELNNRIKNINHKVFIRVDKLFIFAEI